MLMNLSEATDVVKGMPHSHCLCTNVDHGDICAQRAHFLITCAQKYAKNFECVHGTCPVLIDFFPYWIHSDLSPQILRSKVMRNNVFADKHCVFYQLTFKTKCPFIVGASLALVETAF